VPQRHEALQLATHGLARDPCRGSNRRGVDGALAGDADDALEAAMLGAKSSVAHAGLDRDQSNDLGDAREVEVAEAKLAPVALYAVQEIPRQERHESGIGLRLHQDQTPFRPDPGRPPSRRSVQLAVPLPCTAARLIGHAASGRFCYTVPISGCRRIESRSSATTVRREGDGRMKASESAHAPM